jgi:uncharacterized membrane protein YgcG
MRQGQRRTLVKLGIAATLGAVAATAGGGAFAQAKKYDAGANDREIKIGHIGPYSGPASAYGSIGKAIGAYFEKVNAEGGINGRKIKVLTQDDGYNPAKTVEMTRKLEEEEEMGGGDGREGGGGSGGGGSGEGGGERGDVSARPKRHIFTQKTLKKRIKNKQKI